MMRTIIAVLLLTGSSQLAMSWNGLEWPSKTIVFEGLGKPKDIYTGDTLLIKDMVKITYSKESLFLQIDLSLPEGTTSSQRETMIEKRHALGKRFFQNIAPHWATGYDAVVQLWTLYEKGHFAPPIPFVGGGVELPVCGKVDLPLVPA